MCLLCSICKYFIPASVLKLCLDCFTELVTGDLVPHFYRRGFHNHNSYCMTWLLESKNTLIWTPNTKLHLLIFSLHLDHDGKGCFCWMLVTMRMFLFFVEWWWRRWGCLFFSTALTFLRSANWNVPFEQISGHNGMIAICAVKTTTGVCNAFAFTNSCMLYRRVVVVWREMNVAACEMIQLFFLDGNMYLKASVFLPSGMFLIKCLTAYL